MEIDRRIAYVKIVCSNCLITRYHVLDFGYIMGELITVQRNLKPPSAFTASFVSGADFDECEMLLSSAILCIAMHRGNYLLMSILKVNRETILALQFMLAMYCHKLNSISFDLVSMM